MFSFCVLGNANVNPSALNLFWNAPTPSYNWIHEWSTIFSLWIIIQQIPLVGKSPPEMVYPVSLTLRITPSPHLTFFLSLVSNREEKQAFIAIDKMTAWAKSRSCRSLHTRISCKWAVSQGLQDDQTQQHQKTSINPAYCSFSFFFLLYLFYKNMLYLISALLILISLSNCINGNLYTYFCVYNLLIKDLSVWSEITIMLTNLGWDMVSL